MKKIIFALVVIAMLALVGCAETVEDTDGSGVGSSAPTMQKSSFASRVGNMFTRPAATTPDLEIPENPFQAGAEIEAVLVGLDNGIADLQFTYNVPQTAVKGLENDVVAVFDVQFEFPMSMDAIMEDFQTFIDASTSHGTISGSDPDGTTYSGTYGEFSGEVKITNPDGSETHYSWDNDKNNNGIHDTQEKDGISPESERFPIVVSQMMVEATYALGTQENTQLILENKDNVRALNSLKAGLADDIGQNIEMTLGDSYSVEVTNVQVM